jgi:hypothetical protein
MKDIIIKLNEAKQEEYRVSFLDVTDSDGMPMTVSILVDKQYSKMFEKFLEDQQDNIFSHAEGGNVEY